MGIFFIKDQILRTVDTLILTMLSEGLIAILIAVVAFEAGRKYERSQTQKKLENEDWEPKEPTL